MTAAGITPETCARGHEHSCISGARTPRCVVGISGLPKRNTCPGCGGALHTRKVTFAVVPHDPSNRYPWSSVVATYNSAARADRARNAYSDQYVVRALSLN